MESFSNKRWGVMVTATITKTTAITTRTTQITTRPSQ